MAIWAMTLLANAITGATPHSTIRPTSMKAKLARVSIIRPVLFA
jgi:hypothetical protein